MGGLFSSEQTTPTYSTSSFRGTSNLNYRPSTPTTSSTANRYASGTLSPVGYSSSSCGIRSANSVDDYFYSSNAGIRSANSVDDYNRNKSTTSGANQHRFASYGIRSADIYEDDYCYGYDYSSSEDDYNINTCNASHYTVSPRTQFYNSVASSCQTRLFWTAMPHDSEVHYVTLPSTHREYLVIQNMFNMTTNKSNHVISKILRVQNPYLMGRYQMKKSELEKRTGYVEEKLLFHGTRAQNVNNICHDNFNWRLHGKSLGHRFGQGVSFSPKSYYASHYSDKKKHDKVMFLAKVMVSTKIVGSGDMVIPPYCDFFKKIRYDTSVKDNEDVIVKYSDDEFYPAYLIYFTAKYLNTNRKPRYVQYMD